ncbi:MAG: hypothetical protein A2939_03635 [Parcubacteria group bacterium RIFCSPLOWO2_01_FULL_48_18]|nr:MAG: hypothetical protein A3J67_02575 [Parcubacteria group bacterium RIFCSPHIGHO2_02_FULL_48_10b]OHB22369.1 MAG: hypothetical protein A2939_03635 [Parcubacteria group bacterium RIFCSPLOWO2_01_FULL_48_18]
MSEQERTRPGGAPPSDTIEVDVTIHGSHVRISVPRGATLSDLIAEIDRQHPLGRVTDYTVMLNDREIKFENGQLKENPLITENSTLSLLRRIIGGK